MAAPARFAMIDGNNFYVSCERVFAPRLRGRAVVVMSNNDGCVVARSEEAKALGVRMAQPVFELRREIEAGALTALSSNYALYGDMSNRMMSIAATFGAGHEVYSIDEVFVDASHWPAAQVLAQASQMRARVLQWIGIPTCVGIAPTKTLAKLANHAAKKGLAPAVVRPDGVFDWADLDADAVRALLSDLPVSAIWGVGRRLAPRLAEMGVHSAWDLREARPELIRRRFSQVMEKTVLELRGQACLELDEITPPRQQLMTSRSFGRDVHTLQDLSEAVCTFASRGAEKLRQQGSVAGAVYVAVRGNPFRPEQPYYSRGVTVPLSVSTDDTRRLQKAALHGLRQIFQAGYAYKKAAVMLTALEPLAQRQADLFTAVDTERASRLMHTLDALNQRYGAGALHFGHSPGPKQQPGWAMRQAHKSPAYTTRWSDILKVG